MPMTDNTHNSHSVVAGMVGGLASLFIPDGLSSVAAKVLVGVLTGLVSGAFYKLGGHVMDLILKRKPK